MFKFIFQGTNNQALFFEGVVKKQCPSSNLEYEKYVSEGNEHHYSMSDDNNEVFKVGMILASCYSKFGHLQNTKFND